MIRIADIAQAGGWAQPAAPPAASHGNLNDPSTWFADAAAVGDVCIAGTPGPTARGLSIEQHAGRVLACLCGERDAAG